MKLYKKIGVPPTEPIAGVHWVASHGPFIVLTIEELREIFHEGHRTGIGRTISQPVDNPVLEKALNNYLTSKGIKLPDNG